MQGCLCLNLPSFIARCSASPKSTRTLEAANGRNSGYRRREKDMENPVEMRRICFTCWFLAARRLPFKTSATCKHQEINWSRFIVSCRFKKDQYCLKLSWPPRRRAVLVTQVHIRVSFFSCFHHNCGRASSLFGITSTIDVTSKWHMIIDIKAIQLHTMSPPHNWDKWSQTHIPNRTK